MSVNIGETLSPALRTVYFGDPSRYVVQIRAKFSRIYDCSMILQMPIDFGRNFFHFQAMSIIILDVAAEFQNKFQEIS